MSEITERASPKEEVNRINFRSDDSMYQRAENIWYALGMANDRFNAIPQIAGWLSMYAEWDKKNKNVSVDG